MNKLWIILIAMIIITGIVVAVGRVDYNKFVPSYDVPLIVTGSGDSGRWGAINQPEWLKTPVYYFEGVDWSTSIISPPIQRTSGWSVRLPSER